MKKKVSSELMKKMIKEVMSIYVISLLFMLTSNIDIRAEEENVSLIDKSDYVLECVELNEEAYLEDIEYIDALPSKVDLSETKFFPPVDHQVSGSCAAWATVYYQYTYEVARLNNWDVKNDILGENIFSPKYIYNFYNGGTDRGTPHLEVPYKLLKDLGSVRKYEFQDEIGEKNWYQGDTYDKTVQVLRNALSTRLKEYYRYDIFDIIANDVPDITSNDDDELIVIKSLLNEGNLLVMTTAPLDYETDFLDNGEEICLYQNGEDYNHAMCIVGYDDNIWYDFNDDKEKQEYEMGAFKVVNSWGTGYKNDGFVWVAYDALNRVSNNDLYNTDKRDRAFRSVYYITVSNYTPEITAEVTVSLCDRGELSVSTAYNKYTNNINKVTYPFFYSPDVYERNPSCGTDYENYTFVVDFTEAVEKRKATLLASEEFNKSDFYYSLELKDVAPNNSQRVSVEKVRWVDANGNILKEESNLGYIGADGCISVTSFIPITDFDLLGTSYELYENESIKLVPSISPSTATKIDLIWTSSNENVATVDEEGNLFYVGVGETTITAKTTDGTNLSDSCTITTYDDHSDSKDRAKLINLDSSIVGNIETAYDIDFFKFVAPSSGKYIFNSEGYTDTMVYVYNSINSVIGYNDDYSEKGYYNFAVACDLTEGETYYIKVIAYDTDTGEYNLKARRTHTNWVTCDVMQSGKHVMIEGSFASIFDKVNIQLGNSTYTIDVPDDLSDVNTTINGVEFSVNFSSSSNGYYIYWDIEAVIPETQNGVSENIICTFSQGELIVIIDMSEY